MRAGLIGRRRLLQVACAGIAGAAGWALVDDVRGRREAVALRALIERQGGFRVLMSDLQARVGPSVVLPDRPVALVDLGPHQLSAMRSLAAALPPYPPGVLARLLDVVALAGTVTFWRDTPVGGFFWPRGICLNAGAAADRGVVTTWLFHHELSSLVRRAVPFDEAAWTRLNPPGFRYLDEAAYRQLLRDRPHEDGDPALWARGFVRPYGLSDPDNDWNTYAEEAFSDAPAFAALVRRYPATRAKAAMLLDTYRRLDPRFMRFFARSGLAAAVA